MPFRARYLVAAALGLCAAHLLPAQEPGRFGLAPETLPSANQQLANTLAKQLQQGGQLRHYSIDIRCREGRVELTGTVTDQTQREEALRIVQGTPGVESVIDRIQFASGPVQQTQAASPPAPLAVATAADAPAPGAMPEPLPVSHHGAPGQYDLNPPRMPPYAWPTYAPYNNFSRVACPTAYPANAWPFIGPVHPFPKVPLGWRSVKLEWEDGYWFFSRTATKYDWWRLKYW